MIRLNFSIVFAFRFVFLVADIIRVFWFIKMFDFKCSKGYRIFSICDLSMWPCHHLWSSVLASQHLNFVTLSSKFNTFIWSFLLSVNCLEFFAKLFLEKCFGEESTFSKLYIIVYICSRDPKSVKVTFLIRGIQILSLAALFLLFSV